MTDPHTGPFVFDTSAQTYLARTTHAPEAAWRDAYAQVFPLSVSVMTVLERMRGHLLAELHAEPSRRALMEQKTREYWRSVGSAGTNVLGFTTRAAVVSAQLMALLPIAPSPPRRSDRMAESRQDRLSRWRFDIMIAATALVNGLPLIHNNPQDFEPLRTLIEVMPERFPGVGPLNLISVKRLAA